MLGNPKEPSVCEIRPQIMNLLSEPVNLSCKPNSEPSSDLAQRDASRENVRPPGTATHLGEFHFALCFQVEHLLFISNHQVSVNGS